MTIKEARLAPAVGIHSALKRVSIPSTVLSAQRNVGAVLYITNFRRAMQCFLRHSGSLATHLRHLEIQLAFAVCIAPYGRFLRENL